LHLLNKQHDEQNDLVDAIAERIQVLGGVCIAIASHVAEMTLIPRPPNAAKKCRAALVVTARK
jgi:starvation-inducible DNA-binding protein